MSSEDFSNTAINLSKNPLGIIGLCISFVYGLGVIVLYSPGIDYYQRWFLIIFLMVFPFFILVIFYKLVTKHHDKLYAPYDFQNEDNFIRLSKKVDDIGITMEKVQKAIDDQPLYKYTKLSEEGKRLILGAFHEDVNLDDFLKTPDFDKKITDEQIIKLESYGWITKKENIIKITERGHSEVDTFQDLAYGRLC
ncbi:hypothetical protein HNP92_001230 [Methanococcus maripaludis]|uniref:Uncharacterized protein n=1 Tax=Methanococcus maripaludis TaxID=39152 RepID=A0A7J9S5K6_METMI|nr:hypothetical protein [Methanococcus maripaludis]MBB6401925.1 hypothetical protein [Methanococcus maripaludis]